jgi:transcriptional regulator with XRE-family HTH domain
LLNQIAPKISQQRLADEIGINKSTLAAYEVGRSEPNFGDLVKLASYFNVSIDDFLGVDCSQKVNPLSRFTTSERVLVTTVDSSARENIEFVPVRALGGYTQGYGDVEYIQKLPIFQLPFLSRDRKYRAFPYVGDSMPPLRSGSVVFGEYMDNWASIKNGTICLIVTSDEGVVLKKVFNYLEDKGVLVLKSLNERYTPYPMSMNEILEIWQFVGYFDERFPE